MTQLPLAAPRMRIGLLGGSFNPPHAAHRQISLTALKRLGLDQVWWLVSPANPLKDTAQLPSLEKRIGAAQRIANHPRIAVTGFAGNGKSLYTVDVLTALKRRYPGVNFVWLMGADNLADIHRWQAWQAIFGLMPIAVLDRPGYRLKARASQAAQRFADFHVDESDAAGLALLAAPAWTVITHPLSGLSSTALRAEAKPKKKKKTKTKPKPKAKAKAVKPAKTPEQKAKAKAAAAKRDKAAKRAKKAAAKASGKAGEKPQVKKPAKASATKVKQKSQPGKASGKAAGARKQGKKKAKHR